MKVYVVVADSGVTAFGSEAEAVAHAEAVGALAVHECHVQGGPTEKPRVQVVRANGHAEAHLRLQVPVGLRPPGPLPPGVFLGPGGKWVNERGEEMIDQPGGMPPNRQAPYEVTTGQCRICLAPLQKNGYCPRGCEQALHQVSQMPNQGRSPPTPGAEGM